MSLFDDVKGGDGDGEYLPFRLPNEEPTPNPKLPEHVPPEGLMIADVVVHYMFQKPMLYRPGDRLILTSDTQQMILVGPDGYVKDATYVDISRTMLPA